jgi:hypothetical protein
MRNSNKNLAISLLAMLSFFALLAALIILLPNILSLWPTPESLVSVNQAQSQASIAAVVAGVSVLASLVVSRQPIWLAGLISPLLLWLSLNTFTKGTSSSLVELSLLLSMPIILLILPTTSGKKMTQSRLTSIVVLGVVSLALALYYWLS